MCGFKFLHGDVGGGNACRYLKVGISIISSRGTQFKCNKMRGLPIKICKCADQPKVCLLNAGPKCYWTSVFVSVLLFFFFLTALLPCEHYYSIWAHSVLPHQPPVSPVHHLETGLTSTAVGWGEDEQTRLSLIVGVGMQNVWAQWVHGQPVFRGVSQWCDTSMEPVSSGSKTEVIVFFFFLSPACRDAVKKCVSVCLSWEEYWMLHEVLGSTVELC